MTDRLRWERQVGESRQAFAAFSVYRELGAARNVDAAYRRSVGLHEGYTRATSRWRVWAARWSWAERAEAWDAHLDDEARRAEEEATRRGAEQLADRRKAQKERELEIGDRLLQRAAEMLALPLVETSVTRETADGNLVQVVTPAGWRVRDSARLAEAGAKLKRLALDMEGPEAQTGRELGDVLAQAFARLAGQAPAAPPDLEPAPPPSSNGVVHPS